MVFKNPILFFSLLMVTLPNVTFASDSKQALKKLHRQDLDKIQSMALNAIKGMAIQWDYTSCGFMAQKLEDQLNRTIVTSDMADHLLDSGAEVPLLGESKVEKNIRTLKILVDTDRFDHFDEAAAGARRDPAYAALLGGLIASSTRQPNFVVSNCIAQYLKEQDQVRSAVSAPTPETRNVSLAVGAGK